MFIASLVLVAVIGAMFPGTLIQPAREEGAVFPVKIILIGPEGRCPSGVIPRHIIVHKDRAKHCVEGTLMEHNHEDPRFEKTVVRISVGKGQSIRWESETPFRIVGIQQEGETVPGAPKNPFDLSIPTPWGKELNSGPPVKESIGQRYKIELEVRIEGQDVRLDPDLVCTP